MRGVEMMERRGLVGHSRPKLIVGAFLFFLGLTLSQGGDARASVEWPNEPVGASVVLDWPFSAVTGGGLEFGSNAPSDFEIITDTTAPLSPSNVLQSKRPAKSGGGVHLLTTFTGGTESYVAVKWKINSNFQGNQNNNNKLFFMNPTSINSFIGIKGVHTADATGPLVLWWATNTSGMNQAHIPGAVEGTDLLPNITATPVTRNVWHTVELYGKASTTSTSRDGIVRWWLDGVLQGNYTNVNYGPGPFTKFNWTSTWSGGDCGSTGTTTGVCGAGSASCEFNACVPFNTLDWYHRIDHLRISTPSGGRASDTTSPLQPVGLRVQ